MNEKKTAKTLRFAELGSTNDYAKSLRTNGENLFVVEQRRSHDPDFDSFVKTAWVRTRVVSRLAQPKNKG